MVEGAICVAVIGNRKQDRRRKNEKNAKRVSMPMWGGSAHLPLHRGAEQKRLGTGKP